MCKKYRHITVMWFLHYKTRKADGLRAVSSLPLAVKDACEFIDGGAEVSLIDGDSGLEAMNADAIRLAYAARKSR